MSPTRFFSGWAPVTDWVKFSMRSFCQPGSRLLNHSMSVGPWLRTPTEDGVRWKTRRSLADLATAGTTCTAVAPVPITPTTLSPSLSSGSKGPPPVSA